jgi:hypothetical protein
MMATPFRVGDIVLTPDDDLATVVYLPSDGRIAVETPWSAQWVRYKPSDLRPVEQLGDDDD